jgi:hypothetical protein
VPKVCQNAMFFEPLGLALSEKQIPQVNENTEEENWLLEPLESVGTRPRQARYQAALRPDTKCVIHSKALSSIIANRGPLFGYTAQLTGSSDCCFERQFSDV